MHLRLKLRNNLHHIEIIYVVYLFEIIYVVYLFEIIYVVYLFEIIYVVYLFQRVEQRELQDFVSSDFSFMLYCFLK